jgi:seryl-tRNA synthetase
MSSHPDLLSKLGIVNLEAGAVAAGGRGYYLLGQGVMMNQALINYSLRFLADRGFEPVQTPFFMVRDVMAECAQLSQFDDELYRYGRYGKALAN